MDGLTETLSPQTEIVYVVFDGHIIQTQTAVVG
jgi:hypothetical protein